MLENKNRPLRNFIHSFLNLNAMQIEKVGYSIRALYGPLLQI